MRSSNIKLDRFLQAVGLHQTNIYTGWHQKVSHYQMIKNRIKACQ